MAAQDRTPPPRVAYLLNEVADLYGVHINTVKRWAGRGYLEIHKLDGRVFIMAEDVTALTERIRNKCFTDDQVAS